MRAILDVRLSRGKAISEFSYLDVRLPRYKAISDFGDLECLAILVVWLFRISCSRCFRDIYQG